MAILSNSTHKSPTLNILNSLKSQKALRAPIELPPPPLDSPEPSAFKVSPISTQLSNTIARSNKLNLSHKNSSTSIASILNNISKVKIAVNMRFKTANVVYHDRGGLGYLSIARHTVLATMMININVFMMGLIAAMYRSRLNFSLYESTSGTSIFHQMRAS